MSVEFQSRLRAACVELDCSLTLEQEEKLLLYIQQLQRWNRTYNLTALRDPEQMLIQHVFDSLSVVKPLQTYAGYTALDSLRIVDVGSGAGLPGLVLATACSTWNITCIDAVEKKMAFVRQMSGVLRLPNLQATHTRIETLDPLQADVVTSRAFSSLLDFVNLASRHVNETGIMLAMKGKVPTEEIQELEAHSQWKVNKLEMLSVPELDAQRCLVWMSR